MFGSLFGGEFDDMDHEWFSVIGGAMCMTMMINTGSPHLVGVFKAKLNQIKAGLCAACCVKTTQYLFSTIARSKARNS